MQTESRFLWIDLEMTGLDISKDVIIEIASLITDNQLTIIAEGPHHIIHQPAECLEGMIPLVKTMHTQSGLLPLVQSSTTDITTAYKETFNFVKKHCQRRNTFLAGNSVWMDRIFLEKYMPHIINYLHYRLIDVSSFKLITNAWYPKPDTEPKKDKKGTHRALDDIRESLAELALYRKLYFK